MTHDLCLVRRTLSDGSEVFDVSINGEKIPCPTERDANTLIDGIAALFVAHALDECRIRFERN